MVTVLRWFTSAPCGSTWRQTPCQMDNRNLEPIEKFTRYQNLPQLHEKMQNMLIFQI